MSVRVPAVALSVLAAAALLVTPAAARPVVAAPGASLALALRGVVRAGAPGAVALVKRRSGQWTGTAGFADLARPEPMRRVDAFRISSITKTFVATIVLQLVGERRMSLDDTVERWLPGSLPNGSLITVRDLLDHRSGLDDYTDDPEFRAAFLMDPSRSWTPQELLAIAAKHASGGPANTPLYSNTNFLVLGLIVEAVTHSSLADELHRRILEPLHLAHTVFLEASGIPLPHAHGYVEQLPAPPWPPPVDGLTDTSGFNASALWGSTNLVSTVDDLNRFFTALLGGRLLRPAELRAMTTLQRGPGWLYGLGLLATKLRCGIAYGHWGNVLGNYSYAFFTKTGRRGIVVSINIGGGGAPTDRAFMNFVNTAYCNALRRP